MNVYSSWNGILLTYRNIPNRIPNTSHSGHRQTRPSYLPRPCDGLTLAQFSLHVLLPPTYPDVAPELSLSLAPTSPRSPIPKEQYSEILLKLNEAAEENAGIAMIFTLVSILKETLEELLISAEERAKESVRIAEEREKQKLRDEVDAEIRSLRRTPVTYELFLEWKAKFCAWKDEQKNKGNDVENVRGRNREKEKREDAKLTGREVFERKKAEEDEGFEEGEEDGLVEREERGEDEDVKTMVEHMEEMNVEPGHASPTNSPLNEMSEAAK